MNPPVFLSPDALAARLAGAPNIVRLIEVRRDDTEPGPDRHLPGAVVASLTADLSRPAAEPTEGKRPLPRIGVLQSTLRRWGIDDHTPVVVYDYDGSFVAARAWWVLRWAGVADVAILDGGLPAWLAAGHPDGLLATDVAPGDITVAGGHLDELDADRAADLAGQGRLVDARTADAFAKGHIPGARSVSSRDTVTAAGTLHDGVTLRARYDLEAGADVPGFYCGGGVAGAQAVAALAHLGIDAALYVGSFSAWSADPGRPVTRNPAEAGPVP